MLFHKAADIGTQTANVSVGASGTAMGDLQREAEHWREKITDDINLIYDLKDHALKQGSAAKRKAFKSNLRPQIIERMVGLFHGA